MGRHTVYKYLYEFILGYKVSDTMRKGILDINVYENHEKELMLGCLSALAASAAWLLVATFFKLPISGTHSIVGASIGFSLVAKGTKGLHLRTLFMISKCKCLSEKNVLHYIYSLLRYSIICVYLFLYISIDQSLWSYSFNKTFNKPIKTQK